MIKPVTWAAGPLGGWGGEAVFPFVGVWPFEFAGEWSGRPEGWVD